MSSAGQKFAAGGIPGERIETVEITSNSAGVTTTETTVGTIVLPQISGRIYRLNFEGAVDTTVAADKVDVRFREDSSSGNERQLRRVNCDDNSGRWPVHLEFEWEAPSTGNKTFVVTIVRASGTGSIVLIASSTIPTYIYGDYVRG